MLYQRSMGMLPLVGDPMVVLARMKPYRHRHVAVKRRRATWRQMSGPRPKPLRNSPARRKSAALIGSARITTR